MSWDSYIANMTGSGNIEKAAICGLDGSVWAASGGFTVKKFVPVPGMFQLDRPCQDQ